MSTPKVFESEYRFCCILWDNEGASAAALAALAKERLGWSRTTTYTVIKRLGERGVLQNEGGEVRSLYSKEDIQFREIDELVEKTFAGSLPAFVAAFTRHKKLTQEQAEEIRRMIADYTED